MNSRAVQIGVKLRRDEVDVVNDVRASTILLYLGFGSMKLLTTLLLG